MKYDFYLAGYANRPNVVLEVIIVAASWKYEEKL